MSDPKLKALSGLRQEIEKRFPAGSDPGESWFFPRGNEQNIGIPDVHGYEGTGPVMLIAQRPSLGGVPGSGDSQIGLSQRTLQDLYAVLGKKGLSQSHLTDVVKQRGSGDPTGDELFENWTFFKKELEIVQPKVILSLGNWVWNILGGTNPWGKIFRVTHYSYRFRSRATFSADIERDEVAVALSELTRASRE